MAGSAVQELTAFNKPSRITCNIDLGAVGKHYGYLTAPYSRNESAWGSIQVPIITICHGTGPTILFTGGIHGDEYEGQVALMNLARELEPEQLQGRAIIVPSLNLPAVRAATRLSPVDGLNMNRIFPGRRDGTVSEMLADYVYTQLLPLTDIVVDLHSGGRSLDFVPSAVMHFLDDPSHFNRTLAAVKAFGAPLGLVLRELDSEGMLDTAVEDLGKTFISTELGGSSTLTAGNVAIARTGVENLLCHFGLLEGEPTPPEVFGRAPTRLMQTPDDRSFVIAEDDGIFEILADLGTEVTIGQPIGRIHDFNDPKRPPTLYDARRSGVVFSRHAMGLIKRGDCLAVIAIDWEG